MNIIVIKLELQFLTNLLFLRNTVKFQTLLREIYI